MPVFTRMKDNILVLTVDGDYTPNEVRRVWLAAFEAHDSDTTIPVLLDLSGAAGLNAKTDGDWEATGAIFGAFADRIHGIAAVVSPEFFDAFQEGSVFQSRAVARVGHFASHADAREWLNA